MTRAFRLLLIGVEDLVGVAFLGVAGAVLVETLLPSPETSRPIGVFGYVLFGIALTASAVLFLAANDLLRSKVIRPRWHVAAAFCTLLAPALGLVWGHI
jgi:hypothetical protein